MTGSRTVSDDVASSGRMEIEPTIEEDATATFDSAAGHHATGNTKINETLADHLEQVISGKTGCR